MRVNIGDIVNMTDKQLEEALETLNEDTEALKAIRNEAIKGQNAAEEHQFDDMVYSFSDLIEEIENEFARIQRGVDAISKEIENILKQRVDEGWDWRMDYDRAQSIREYGYE